MPFSPPEEFRPRRWLGNGHLQTIAGNFLPRRLALPPAVTELIPVPLPPEMRQLPGAIALDERLPSRVLCHCHWQPREAPATVVLVHGLEGSSRSQYVLGNSAKLWLAGFHVIRMNMRNCGGTDALSPTLYHSGLSGDVLAVLRWCLRRGLPRVVLAGYSMGGNLVLKAAGELGTSAPAALIGVAAVSPPIDLAESADALHLRSNRIYERRFLRNLSARYRRKAHLFPAIYREASLRHVHSIRDFDQQITGPYCGFSGAADYYARSGASRVLSRIAVPTLLIHALDDPFIRLTAATRRSMESNPSLQLLEPRHGGHCAFLENPNPRTGYDGYWAERQLLRFAQQRAAVCAEEAVPSAH